MPLTPTRRRRAQHVRRKPRRRLRNPALLGLLGIAVVVVLALTLGRGLLRQPEPDVTPTAVPTNTPTQLPVTDQALYVSPEGDNDGVGSLDDPFRTVAHALEEATPGTTIFLRAGTYRERIKDVPVAAGTEAQPIVLTRYQQETPELVGLLWLRDASYWTVSGLTVRWSEKSSKDEHMVKFDGGDHWTFADNDLSGAQSFAALLVAGNAGDWVVRDNRITDTKKANDDNQDHLIYVNSTGSSGLIERNYLADSPNGRAVKVGPPDDGGDPVAGGLTIRYNTMERNLGPSNVQLAFKTSNVTIERNIMVEPAPNYACVTAHKLTGENNVVLDNLIWASKAAVQKDVPGLRDGGGNIRDNPARFTSRYGQTAKR